MRVTCLRQRDQSGDIFTPKSITSGSVAIFWRFLTKKYDVNGDLAVNLAFLLDLRMSDKNMPFTQSLHHKFFTLVCLLHTSDPDIGRLDYHHYIVIALRNTFQVFIVIYFTQRKLPCKLLGFNQDVLLYHNPLSNLFWPVGWRKRQFSDLSYWTIRQITSPTL